jgi:hypothetical protein
MGPVSQLEADKRRLSTRAGLRAADRHSDDQCADRLSTQPKRWGIRQFFFELEPDYVTNLGNRLNHWRVFMARFNVRTES